MFIKPFPKYNKTTKERYTVYCLCESYRFDGHIRHRTIIGFGKLDELPEEGQKKQLALRIEEMLKYGVNYLGKQSVQLKKKISCIPYHINCIR
jgi:hypothetical protein